MSHGNITQLTKTNQPQGLPTFAVYLCELVSPLWSKSLWLSLNQIFLLHAIEGILRDTELDIDIGTHVDKYLVDAY